MSGKQNEHFMFVYTTVLYEYMKSLKNDIHNLSDNVRTFYVCVHHSPVWIHERAIISYAKENPKLT